MTAPAPYPYETATPEQRALGSLWWCIHHDRKLEPLTEPIERRVESIRLTKASHERETRLRALRPASVALAPAWKAYDEALASASKAYHEAVAPARKAYDEALASASKAYDEALAPASKAYDEALAPALKAYDEAVAPAWKAYHEAVASARKAYDEALASAWAVECADVPWGLGGLVFPEVTP